MRIWKRKFSGADGYAAYLPVQHLAVGSRNLPVCIGERRSSFKNSFFFLNSDGFYIDAYHVETLLQPVTCILQYFQAFYFLANYIEYGVISRGAISFLPSDLLCLSIK